MTIRQAESFGKATGSFAEKFKRCKRNSITFLLTKIDAPHG